MLLINFFKMYVSGQEALFAPLVNITNKHPLTEEGKENRFLASEIGKQWTCAECFHSMKPSLCIGTRLPLCRMSCDDKYSLVQNHDAAPLYNLQ